MPRDIPNEALVQPNAVSPFAWRIFDSVGERRGKLSPFLFMTSWVLASTALYVFRMSYVRVLWRWLRPSLISLGSRWLLCTPQHRSLCPKYFWDSQDPRGCLVTEGGDLIQKKFCCNEVLHWSGVNRFSRTQTSWFGHGLPDHSNIDPLEFYVFLLLNPLHP